MKSMAFDKKSTAFDTKSNKVQDRKSIAFDKTPVAFHTKSNGNCKQTMRNRTEIKSFQQEANSIRYEIGGLQKIDKKSA